MSDRLENRGLVTLLRKAYLQRINEALEEADVFDKKGNLVIRKGLKVRHKDSQYEYTVDTIDQNPRTGEIQLTLRLPEEPRFQPPGAEGVLGETDLVPPRGEEAPIAAADELADDDVIFTIDQEEFEKDYEVK